MRERSRRRAVAAAFLLLLTGVASPLLSAQSLGWKELRAVIERGVHLRMPDAQLAARLRKIQPAEAVPPSTEERAASWDAGPLTQRELRRLTERSASLPRPAQEVELRPNPRLMPPVADGEAAVVVELARLYAQEYTESIPNFLCFRNTRFLKESSPLGRWKLDAEIKERLSHVGDEDEHEAVAVDGKPARGNEMVFHGGLTVSGEFGNVMRRIFDPETETVFTRMESAAGEDSGRVAIGFRVEQALSSMRIRSGDDEEVVMGYAGEVYASPSTGQIYRIRLTMDALEKHYPIRGATWDIRYGPVKVEEQELLLPVSAAVEAYQTGRFVRTEATYTDYQKYSADSQIRFGETAPNPEPPNPE